MEIYKKLAQARSFIKASPVKKAGYNQHSKYWYYTPEQISAMVHEAENATGLIHKFDLKREQFTGLHGYLLIIDTEDGETIAFTQATEIPAITATNIAQQVGGAVTYTNRYMLTTAYDISDNSLDFDATDDREKPEAKPAKPVERKPMPDDSFVKMCDALRKAETSNAAVKIQMGQTKYYTFDDQQTKIINEIIDNK